MIYLYALDTPKLNPHLSTYGGAVPQSRLDQIAALPQQDQMLSLAAELLFQRTVKRHCPGMPRPVSRDSGKFGKPYLVGCPDFHFNLSHSGLWAVCAVADVPVGVDLQQERPVSPKLSRKFTSAEQQALASAPLEQWASSFFDLWVEKEAYTKCIGRGLLCPFSSFEGATPAPGYSVQLVPFPAGGYHLAVCAQSEEPQPVQLVIMPS